MRMNRANEENCSFLPALGAKRPASVEAALHVRSSRMDLPSSSGSEESASRPATLNQPIDILTRSNISQLTEQLEEGVADGVGHDGFEESSSTQSRTLQVCEVYSSMSRLESR